MTAVKAPTLEDVWRAARRAAPTVLHRCGVPVDRYPPEDLVSDLMLKFIRNGSLWRYDAQKSGLGTYVSTCLHRLVISRLRRKNRQHVSLDVCAPLPDHATLHPPEACEILLGYILNVVLDQPLGTGPSFWVDGVLYPCSVHSVLRLISRGYTYADVARSMGLKRAYVAKISKRECEKVVGLREML